MDAGLNTVSCTSNSGSWGQAWRRHQCEEGVPARPPSQRMYEAISASSPAVPTNEEIRTPPAPSPHSRDEYVWKYAGMCDVSPRERGLQGLGVTSIRSTSAPRSTSVAPLRYLSISTWAYRVWSMKNPGKYVER